MRIERIEKSKHKQERVLVHLEDGNILRITGAELLQGLLLHRSILHLRRSEFFR